MIALGALMMRLSDHEPMHVIPSGTVCRRLREEAGVSQHAAAVIARVGHSTLERYERGEVSTSRQLQASESYRRLLSLFIVLAEEAKWHAAA